MNDSKYGRNCSAAVIPSDRKERSDWKESRNLYVRLLSLFIALLAGMVACQTETMGDADMVYVPAGEFIMGSDVGELYERPVHTVYLDGFWIDRTAVTNGQYQECVEAGACRPPQRTHYGARSSYYGDPTYHDYPVVYVNWHDADAYCHWVGKRLPTEAEWEKAARGTDGRIYPWGNDKPRAAWLDYIVTGDTTVAGSFAPGASPYGALEMTSNVWQWVGDWYDADYYKYGPSRNPSGPTSARDKVVRGCSRDFSFAMARTYTRFNYRPSQATNYLGFRCARSEKE